MINENLEGKSHAEAMCGRRTAAVVLLVVAVAALAGPHLPFNWRDSFLLLMGVAFIVWSALVRSPGLLVPGGVLVGIGTGILLREEYGNGAFLLSMSGGFLLIALLSPLLFRGQKRCRWAFWPAAGLAFSGLLQFAGRDLREAFRAVQPFWPYVLIAVALFLFFSKPTSKA
jgi:hypothetical protein